MISKEELLAIMPHSAKRLNTFYEPLRATMIEFEIDTPLRIAAFVAQIAHESGELQYVRELATGAAYEGRADLGNTEKGDGPRFLGRGLIQLTGRINYTKCGEYLGIDLVNNPPLLETPEPACRSAGWFWHVYKNLNPLADREDFLLITKRINGGTNGWRYRIAYYERAKEVLGR